MAPERVGLKPLGWSLAAAAVIEFVLSWAMASGRLSPMTALGWGRMAEVFAFMIIFSRWGGGLGRIGLSREAIRPGLIKGVIWSCGIGAVTGIVFFTLFLLEVNPLTLLPVRLPREVPARIALFAVGGLIGPVAEEMFFRGILYGYLRRWGVIPAMAVSTAGFVLLHSTAGVTQIAGGILFAAAYETEGRLMTPITIHVAGNTALFALPLIVPLFYQP